MSDLAWILPGSFAMSAIAMAGSVTALLPPAILERVLLPLVALAAGTLLGGAFFHGGDAVHDFLGGWSRRRALLWNFVCALTFPLGAVVAWTVARHVEVSGPVFFADGNFIYIAASDLIPEIKHERDRRNALVHFACFAVGLSSMFAIARWMRAG